MPFWFTQKAMLVSRPLFLPLLSSLTCSVPQAGTSQDSVDPSVSYRISPACCGFKPDSVDLDQWQRWCVDRVNTCATLCNRDSSKNSCNAVSRFAVVVFSSLSERQTDLSYECDYSTTFGGKLSRNVSEFAQTLPSYQCSIWRIRCSALHSKDASAAAD